MNQRIRTTTQLDSLHEVISRLGLQQPCHVLDADGVAAHLLQLLRHVNESLDCMQRADRIRDCPLSVLPRLFHSSYTGLEVAQIIESIKDTKYIHAVRSCLIDEALDHRILVVPIA